MLKKTKPQVEKRSIFKKIAKIFLYLFLSIIILITLLNIYFYINKDELSRDLILKVNNLQSGEVNVGYVSLAPFERFPEISLNLENVVYFENPKEKRDKTELPFCKLDNIYLSFHLMDLLKGNINVSKITLSDGYFKGITYKDSTTNLSRAFSAKVDSTTFLDDEITIVDTAALIDKTVEEKGIVALEDDVENFLLIEDLTIKNVTIEFVNQLFERKSSILIKQLQASFEHLENMNDITLVSDLTLNYYQLNDKTIIQNNLISIDTDLLFDEKKQLITINPSEIIFDGATLDLEGSFDLEKDGYIDLKVGGAANNFSILSLVFNDEFIRENRENLLSGRYYFNGIVQGNTYNNIPFMEFSFGVKDVNLNLEKFGRSINDLNFDAFITTGKEEDFSDSYLKIENYSAKLPQGKTSGNLSVTNFSKPYIDLECYLKTDLKGFEDLLNLDFIDKLDGIVTLDTEIKGEIDFENEDLKMDELNFDIQFEDAAVNIPEVISLANINGIIHREDETLKIENLAASIWDTDVLINGDINNLISLYFGIESEINADISIVSEKFNLPKVLSFEPSIGRNFNHVINNFELNVKAMTTTNKLTNFDKFPAIDFDIKYLNGAFNDFPNLEIFDSDLSIYEDTSGFNMKFNPFNVNGANGNVALNGSYNGSYWKPLILKSKVKSTTIDMLDLLNQFNFDLDSTSFFNAVIDGDFDFRIEFPHDSLDFKIIELTNADLEIDYLAKKDTIITKSLNIELNDIYYDTKINSNPMATLSTFGFIQGERFKTRSFDVEDFRQDISSNNGRYEIIPKSRSIFGAYGNGKFVVEPWADVPNYHFNYSINQFNIQDLLASFLEDSPLNGKMNLSLDLEMVGDNWDSVKSKMNGEVNIDGENLLLYGIDADEVLKRLERSQNFNLVDVGAVLLTGPVGLAVTKGTDMAVLVAAGVGDSTEIPKFVSKWNISNGNASLTDVAFSTHKNRVAAIGKINISDETLDLTFGVLEKDGSLRISQNITGKFDDPKMGKINVLSSVLSPVTNLWNSVLQIEGEVFYDGSVKHPE